MTKSQYKILIIKRAGIMDGVRQVSDLGGNSIFAPANVQYLSVEKLTSGGSFYLKVKNKTSGEDVKIGVLAIDNIRKKQHSIEEFNRIKRADMPNITDNPIYYITSGDLRLANFRSSQYSELQRAFFKGRSAKNRMEVQEVEIGPNHSNGLAEFVSSNGSEILTFASSKTKYRVLIASLAKSK